jgi:hypothetical protein
METDEKANRIQTIPPIENRKSKIENPPTLRALRIRYTDPRRADAHPFFAPLAPVGLHYDLGWLGAYVLAYLATLLPARLLLRIP